MDAPGDNGEDSCIATPTQVAASSRLLLNVRRNWPIVFVSGLPRAGEGWLRVEPMTGGDKIGGADVQVSRLS